MGDFNPNLPSLAGSEVFPTRVRTVDVGNNPFTGLAMRCVPGAITPTNIGTWDKLGSKNSLHAVELVDTLTPACNFENTFPGTGTGALGTGGWADETGAAITFGKVAKFNDDSTYASIVGSNPAAVPPVTYKPGWSAAIGLSSFATLQYRGGRATTLLTDGLRPVSVTINVRMACNLPSSGALSAGGWFFNFILTAFGGSNAYIVLSTAIKPATDGQFHNYSLTLAGDPWAMASYIPGFTGYYARAHAAKTWGDYLTTAGPYAFGVAVNNSIGGGGAVGDQVRISGMWLGINTCPENRKVAAYPQLPLNQGWNKTPALHPNQRIVRFTSNAATTALTTPAGGTAGAADFTAADVGAKIVRASDGQVVGTVQSVTNSTTAVLVAVGASTNANVVGYLGTQAVALTAAQYYYAVHSQVPWNAKSSILMDLVQDPNLQATTSAATVTGEHRTCYNLQMTNAGSMVAAIATPTVGELLPTLIDTSLSATPSLASQSQPYAALFPTGAGVGQKVGVGIVGQGQQITTAGATTYSGVKFPVGRFSQVLDPDQPLNVQIQSGAGGLTGAGTVVATGTLLPSSLTGSGQKLTTVTVPFVTPFLSVLSTQYYLVLKSSAGSTRPWAVFPLDCRTDVIVAGSGLTALLIESQGIANVTDSWVPGLAGAATTREDIPAALVVAPTAPAGLTATPKVAA